MDSATVVTTARGAATAADRLNSWKEIAAYLGRTVRTVQRWERTCDLPVHRHRHSEASSIYAFRSELDGWWSSRGENPDAGAGRSAASASSPATPRRLTRELLALLHQASREHRLVLLLEDLNWEDPATRDRLAYIASCVDGLPVLVVLSPRSATG